mmetsp:Transcript_25632/g.49065  ORF Transcript_25632/g.49065 Transcript_25632/m.49065 type:complete len:157 (-) Transcript_25632:32-502(-)
MKTGGGNLTTPLQAALETGPQFPAYREFMAKGWIVDDGEADASVSQDPIMVEDDEEMQRNLKNDESWWTVGAQPVDSNNSSTARPSRSRSPFQLSHGQSHYIRLATLPARSPWRAPRSRVAEAVEAAPTVHMSASSAYELPVSVPTTSMSGAMCNH